MLTFVHNPSGSKRLGDLLLRSLRDPSWSEFKAAVAFVKASGVRRISRALREFGERGRVSILVGIDLSGTSVEGLAELLAAVPGGSIHIFHNRNRSESPTFHPKIYLFSSESHAECFVGSGNLTKGGLFTNYEAFVHMLLDRSIEADCKLLAQVESTLESWIDPSSGTSQLLTADLIARLERSGELPSEEEVNKRTRKAQAKNSETANSELDELFKAVAVTPAPPVSKAIEVTGAQPAGPAMTKKASGTSTGVTLEYGRLLWRKILKPSDVETGGPRKNPTGGLRLTQAKFETALGRRIDHTKYFRYEAFKRSKWNAVKRHPFTEAAFIPFDVEINGDYKGRLKLRVSHKPSGEASQGNYTTMLHWGELAETIRTEVSANQIVEIYAPTRRAKTYILRIG